MTGSVADSWSGASYERIAETFARIHGSIVHALAVDAGARVLDVACGTGGVALRAEQVYRDHLAPGVLDRQYVLVLGIHR